MSKRMKEYVKLVLGNKSKMVLHKFEEKLVLPVSYNGKLGPCYSLIEWAIDGGGYLCHYGPREKLFLLCPDRGLLTHKELSLVGIRYAQHLLRLSGRDKVVGGNNE